MSALAAAFVGGSVLAGGVGIAGLSVGATAALAAGGTALAAGTAQSAAQRDVNRTRAQQMEAAERIAGQADRASELSYQLGQDQLAFARQQYDELSPLARRVSEGQISAQDEQLRQARDYYDYSLATFRPLEQGLARDAEAFDTEAYRERLAEQAAVDAARAFENVQGSTSRGLSRMGVAPGSGAAMSQMNQNDLRLASMRAGAMTGARTQAEQLGWARRLDVTGLGRNLPGASTAAYTGATGAGSAGLSSASAPGQAFIGNMGSAANTMLAGSGQALGAYGNLYSGATNMALGAQDNLYGLQGAFLGTAGTIGAGMLGRRGVTT
jgi:hypothetical protein